MNCDDARRRLLAEEQPDRTPDDDVRRHLAACAACRALSRRLALVERQIPFLPVPSSSAKSAFVRRFLRTGGPVVKHLPLPWPKPIKERGLQKLSLAVAIAAVLAVFTLAWWSWPRVPAPSPAPHPEPLWVAQIHKERDRIRALPEPRERVEQLTALAKELRGRAEALTHDGDADGLASLASVYADVVRKDLFDHANAVPASQRQAVLAGIVKELFDANSQFERDRGAASHAGASMAGPLRDLAKAALDSGQDLQRLLKAA